MTPEEPSGATDAIRRWLAQWSPRAATEVRLRVPPEPRTRGRDVPAPGQDPRRTAARQRRQVSDATDAARSTEVVFPPRTGIRRLLTVLMLVMGAGAVVAGGVAYVERTQPTVLAAAGLVALALVVWGARAAAAPVSVALRNGVLEVRRAGRVETADLANARTPIAVVGKPSSRRWRVLIERANEPLLVVDASMVDPEAFTRVLYHVHPHLWSDPGALLEPWQLR